MARRTTLQVDAKLLYHLRGTSWHRYKVDDPEHRVLIIETSPENPFWTRLDDLARAGKEVRISLRIRSMEG